MNLYAIGTLVRIRTGSVYYEQHDGYGMIYGIRDNPKEKGWYEVKWDDGYKNTYSHKHLERKMEDNEDALCELSLFSSYQ